MLTERLSRIVDGLTEWTGLVATRVPLCRASGLREVTLDLPGYAQLDTYCCGAVAGVMALKHLKPNASFSRFHDRVNPTPELGTSTTRLIRALRQSGTRVQPRHALTFADLCASIDAGHPVLVVIQNPGAKDEHWVVVYGYGKRPKLVFLATNGFPLLTSVSGEMKVG